MTYRSIRFTALSTAIIAQLALYGCTSESAPPAVASIAMNRQAVTLTPPQTTLLVATPKDAAGNALTGRSVGWATTATAVATVDANGLVTAVSPGAATITATSEGQVGSVAITVIAIPVATVTLSSQAATLVPGQTAALSATTKDASGNTLTGRLVTWGSNATAVATVDSNGVVSAVSTGSASITATSEGMTATATITVNAGAFIGSSGGTATAFGGNATVTIPAGALTASTAITIAQVANPQPNAALVAGTAYDFGPTGTTFAVPVTLTIAFPTASPGVQSQFRIHKLIGTTWTLVAGGTVNTVAHTASAPTSSFSTYAILEVPLPVFTVTLTGSGTGSGTITAPAAGGQGALSCTITAGVAGAGCAPSYPQGTVVQLTAAATAGGSFTTWGGACGGTTNPCALTVSSATAVTATFAPPSFLLTILGSGNGSGTVTAPIVAGRPALACTITAGVAGAGCTQTYPAGTVVPLTAAASGGGSFTSWSGGSCGVSSNPCSTTVSAATTITATFALPNFLLTIQGGSTGNGTVTAPATGGQPALTCGITAGVAGPGCAQSYPQGTAVQLTATATGGGSFSSWTGSNCTGIVNPCTTPVSANTTIVATFASPPGFTAIATGLSTSCGLTTSGAPWCWGYQYAANLTASASGTASLVPGGLLFSSISVGTAQTNISGLGAPAPVCALTAAGAAWCWGSGASGELNNGIFASQAPVPIFGSRVYTAITTGTAHACGLTSAGEIWCWGRDVSGELGDGNNSATNSVPILVAGSHIFTAVAAGGSMTCGLEAGAAWCWGRTVEGEMGNGLTTGNGAGGTSQNTPTAVIGGHLFTAITAGTQFACGLTATGEIWCWGQNTSGALGNGTGVAFSSTPVQVLGGSVYGAVNAGGSTACALTTAGAAYCWGSGPLGNGAGATSSTPLAVAGGLTFRSISAFGLGSLGASCGVTTAGASYCWGNNSPGTVGDGTLAGPRLAPLPVIIPLSATLRRQ